MSAQPGPRNLPTVTILPGELESKERRKQGWARQAPTFGGCVARVGLSLARYHGQRRLIAPAVEPRGALGPTLQLFDSHAHCAQAGWPQSQAISVSSGPASLHSSLQYFSPFAGTQRQGRCAHFADFSVAMMKCPPFRIWRKPARGGYFRRGPDHSVCNFAHFAEAAKWIRRPGGGCRYAIRLARFFPDASSRSGCIRSPSRACWLI